MKIMAKLKRILKHNNRGAGFVTVLVAVMFLASFGSMLLMISWTGEEMRASDRNGKKVLYDAAAVMDEIRAGLQCVCSQAISDTYENALISFNNLGKDDALTEFSESFSTSISNFMVSDEPLFEANKCNLDALQELAIGDTDEDNIEITSTNVSVILDKHYCDVEYKLDEDGNKIGFVLKGIKVIYTNGDKTTSVESDLSVDYPSFEYLFGDFNTVDITSYATIVRGTLKQETGNVGSTVYGKAYFGDVDLTKINKLTFAEGSTIVVPGDIKVSSQGYANNDGSVKIPNKNADGTYSYAHTDYRLVSKGALWANGISLDKFGSSVSLEGPNYIANDLELKGSSSRATISGSYYGFGHQTVGDTGRADSGKSSSILINYNGLKNGDGSKNVYRPTLDLSQTESLTLAGVAYIDCGNDTVSDVQMGESITAKKVQRAYRVDARYIYCEDYDGNRVVFNTNPQIMTPDEFAAINPATWQFTNDYLWNSNKTLSDYNAHPAPRIQPYAGQSQVYVFMEFDTGEGEDIADANEHANKYFLDFYKYNKDYVDSLLDSSVIMLDRNGYAINAGTPDSNIGSASISMRGETGFGRISTVTVAGSTAAIEADYYEEQYYELQHMQSRPPTGEDDTYIDPIDYFLDEINIGELVAGEVIEFKDKDGKVTALISNGDISINSVNYPDVNFVIQTSTTGEIYLGRSFNGVIISSGDLKLADGVHINKAPDKVVVTYQATNTEGNNILLYTQNIANSGWSVNDLVHYEGWRRKTED